MIKLLRYLKPYLPGVIGTLIFTILNVFSQLYIPTLMGDIVDSGVIQGDIPYIITTGTKMLGIAILGGISMVFASYLSSRAAMGYGKDLRYTVFDKVENMSMAEFESLGTASLITRTTNDINQMQQVVLIALRMMSRAPIMLIGGIIMAYTKNKQLSKVLLFSAPILILTIVIVGGKGFPYFKKIQEGIDKLNQVIREELTGIRVIRAFNKQEYENKRFDSANKGLTDTMLEVTRLMALMGPLLNLILNGTTIAIVWFSSKYINMNMLEVGDMLAFIQYVNQIIFALIIVSAMIIMIPRAAASAKRINEVLDIENSVLDKKETKDIPNLEGEIVFDNVSFRYGDAENPILRNINFIAEPGKTTAIIGGTGSGKSTLISLIPRFYDPTEGRVLIDGVDIKDLSKKNVRDNIGFVTQRAELFSGSISDNIKFGKEDATEEEIITAVEIAQAKEFIESLPEGYDSNVSQAGTNFSGGQQQRLSIARALVRKPSIYIFDDSFSALDYKTDRKLREALDRTMKDSTIILVAQRVSTIIDADNILVLDSGEIVAQGTHKKLLETSDVYREIVESQLTEEEIS